MKESIQIIRKSNERSLLYRLILLTFATTSFLSQSFGEASTISGSKNTYEFQKNVCRTTTVPNLSLRTEKLLDSVTKSNHSSSIAPISKDSLLVVWYGGSREGAKDVRIYSSIVSVKDHTSSLPTELCSPHTISRDTLRYVHKVGNPVVFSQNGKIWLFVVSVSYGGWSGSSINYACSSDKGKNWTKFRRLRVTPLFNISTLVRSSCVPQNRGFLLPAYCELATKYGLALKFNNKGKLLGRSKLLVKGNREALQPSIVPTSVQKALAFLRTPTGYIGCSYTDNGGKTWKAFDDVPIDNYNSSVATLRLESGKIILVANTAQDRSKLSIFEANENQLLSNDSSQEQWSLLGNLEDEKGEEFSYPSLIQTPDKSIYLSYTYKRETIKFVNLTDCFYQTNSKANNEKENVIISTPNVYSNEQ